MPFLVVSQSRDTSLGFVKLARVFFPIPKNRHWHTMYRVCMLLSLYWGVWICSLNCNLFILFNMFSAHGATSQRHLEQLQIPCHHQLLHLCRAYQQLIFWHTRGNLQWARWEVFTPSCTLRVNTLWSKCQWAWVLQEQARPPPYMTVGFRVWLLHSSSCTISEIDARNWHYPQI